MFSKHHYGPHLSTERGNDAHLTTGMIDWVLINAASEIHGHRHLMPIIICVSESPCPVGQAQKASERPVISLHEEIPAITTDMLAFPSVLW